MKIKIKSIHDYGTHKEEITEDLECSASYDNNCILLQHNQGYIIIEENKITQVRNENTIIIEAGNEATCEYKTGHGNIMLNIKGLTVEKNLDSKTLAKATYLISSTGITPYKVELEIVCDE